MAPEYLAYGKLTEKVDMYSFGVLLLEIVMGRQNNGSQELESLITIVSCKYVLIHANSTNQQRGTLCVSALIKFQMCELVNPNCGVDAPYIRMYASFCHETI